MNKYILLTIISGGVVILDQASKYAIQHLMTFQTQREIIPGFLNLTYILNPGGAFGLLSNLNRPLKVVVFISMSLIAIALLFSIYIYFKGPGLLIPISIALITGGAAGNFIDRVRLHGVIDFIDLHFRDYHWPAFNIADSAITIGAIALLFQYLRHGEDLEKRGY